MARKLRVEYPGAICYVMNRGDRREDIFPLGYGPAGFSQDPGRSLSEDRVAGACWLSGAGGAAAAGNDADRQLGRRPGATGQFQECDCEAAAMAASRCGTGPHARSLAG